MQLQNKKILIASLFSFLIILNSTQTYSIDNRVIIEKQEIITDYLEIPGFGITNDQQLIDYGIPGNGTEDDPYIIEYIKSVSDSDTAIFIGYITKHLIIRNCIADGYSNGIYIYNCDPGIITLENNTVDSIKGGNSIIVVSTPNVTIIGNRCRNSNVGIRIINSENSTISNNTCDFNTYGIQVFDSVNTRVFNNSASYNKDIGLSVYYSNFSQIYNNTFYNNNAWGYANGMGGFFYRSSYLLIANNTFSDNDYGIYANAIQNSEIVSNLFLYNEFYGIQFSFDSYYPTRANTFHHNCFIENFYDPWVYDEPLSQANDLGLESLWYDISTNVGNYWSNYSGSGSYFIEGRGYFDPYPIIASDSDSDGLDNYKEKYIYLTKSDDNDTDNDNLLDGEEVLVYYTNPLKLDTDLDNLSDGDEVLIYNCDPLNPDTDGDIIKDGIEVYIYGTNPTDSDSDDDSMNDGFEIIYGLNPLLDDSQEDPDTDGLFNYQEAIYNTNPFSEDTDSDGLGDFEETQTYDTNPLREDTDEDGIFDGDEVYVYNTNPNLRDSDSDKLSDYDEIFLYITLPNNNDTDGDLMPDGWEVKYFLDPLVDDSQEDPDEDGLTNLEELKLGTNPLDPDTDGDGFLDGYEVKNNHDPLEPLDYPWESGVKISIYTSSFVLFFSLIGIGAFILSKKGILKFSK